MRYWLGVNASPKAKLDLSADCDTFWCLPETAEHGDQILFYCPRSASSKYQGIYSLGSVDKHTSKRSENNTICNAYKYNNELLCYTMVKVTHIYKVHLLAKQIKLMHSLQNCTMVRRNFQGTIFEITEKQFSAIEKKLEELNN